MAFSKDTVVVWDPSSYASFGLDVISVPSEETVVECISISRVFRDIDVVSSWTSRLMSDD